MKTILLASATVLALTAGAYAAGDLALELTTAENHAGMAAKSANIAGTKMHLHHVLNCLVGVGGEGFDASHGNPCAKAGGAAIPDATSADQRAKLTAALGIVKTGLAATDPAVAAKAAADAQAAIAAAR